MIQKILIQILVLLLLFTCTAFGSEKADIIVAQDGSGDYTTVQEALDAAPSNLTDFFIILIKKGTYNEKIYIAKNYLALVGEDRDSTIIVTAQLRDDWLAEHSSDWGTATVNIQNGVKNLILANLSADNNFADLYPDDPGINSHMMTIRGGGDRVIIINCNVTAHGGDTCSLWDQGYYYHKDCFFEGGVDYVCPRGWCYVTECDFYGYNHGASVWHDGRQDKDMKFVIHNCYFDGVGDFGLGRHHADAQFYLLDCTFSPNLNDNGGILKAGTDELQWGERIYYYNSHCESGDYDWHADNLWEAENMPTHEDLTAFNTFQGKWDPENDMPAVLPYAAIPKPRNEQIKVSLNPTLKWIPGRNAVSHDVYFGTSNPPDFQTNTTEPVYEPGALAPNTIYYWRVDEVTEEGKIEGKVWEFRTLTDGLPAKASNPLPMDKAVDVEGPVLKLVCDFDALSTDTVKTWLGESPDALELVSVFTIPGYQPAPFQMGKTYYWRVDISNQNGTVQGDVWSFTMKGSDIGNADYLQSSDEDGLVVIETEDFTENTSISDFDWTFITDPAGYSGDGAMQLLPDNGTFQNYLYGQRCSRLDYTVNFIKAGTHYIWIRGYSKDGNDNVFHIGLNMQEDRSSSRIGNFQGTGEWEWLNGSATVNVEVRTFEVQALGVQTVSLWYGRDGAIADKIVLTTNPNYVPTGLGPETTYTAVEEPEPNTQPLEFALQQNYPNPFNPTTTIQYSLQNADHVRLVMHDILGREIAILVDEKQEAGLHSVTWNSSDVKNTELASGVYFARLESGELSQTIKLLFLK